jgi:hypothetical protein
MEMFGFFKKKRIEKYIQKAWLYVEATFEPEKPTPTVGKDDHKGQIKYSLRPAPDNQDVLFQKKRQAPSEPRILYSDRGGSSADTPLDDVFDRQQIDATMRRYSFLSSSSILCNTLEKVTNKTFVDAMIVHMRRKGMQPTDVYKGAQIDRKLFSKIMSDKQYKPSKDTAIAIALALQLSLDEANDLLSRAGYVFSHSSKKDIVIEYFIREKIYKLSDINEVLFALEQKIIGR